MNKLNITLNGNEFKHKVYHYIKQCRDFFGLDKIEMPMIISQQHSLNSYDCLIGGLHG
jgi:hypothetical protein